MSKKLKISIPRELADDLADQGIAEIQHTARSATWELVWNAAVAAAEVVTLLQAPETVRKFAESCFRLIKKSPSEKEQRLDAVGPGGQMRLIITPSTDLHEVEQFLAKVLFTHTDAERG